jgi:hypothetical protein
LSSRIECAASPEQSRAGVTSDPETDRLRDRHGRLLATISFDDRDVGEIMIAKGLHAPERETQAVVRSLADTMKEIRATIASGSALDDIKVRRIALQATRFIADPVRADRFEANLLTNLDFLSFAIDVGSPLSTDWARRDVLDLLDAIERASLPN